MAILSEKEEFRKKLKEIFNLTNSELEQKAFLSLISDELKNVEVEIYKILNKHGVSNALELDKFFQDGKIDEASGWEDFFELDALEYKRQMLKSAVDDLED